MPVFRLCLKIIKKNIPSMLIYIGIFLAVSLLISSSASQQQEKLTSYEQVKTNVALVCEESSPLVDGFRQELGKIVNFIELPDDKEKLQDALYFRRVSYIIRVPEGFTESIMKGLDASVEKTVIPNSFTNTYIDLYINQYFNIARLYVNQMEGISQEALVQYVKQDLGKTTAVELLAAGGEPVDRSYSTYYFNYLAYSLLSVLILGISSIMLVFNNRDLMKRNSCSPISAASANVQMILATLLFTFFAWLIMVGFCFLFDFGNSVNLNTVYFLLNSLVFAFCAAGISFLTGNLVKGRNALAAVSNVIALGSCFLSGVFVPQMFLGKAVLRVARLIPTFWYVKANNDIGQVTQFDFINLKPIFTSMLVIMGFGLLFFALAFEAGKRRRVNN